LKPDHGVLARVRSIDVARGLIMVLMAIDHVRVYAAVPAGAPNPAVFFTRWVTHFCAPGFVFFAGTSAYLQRAKLSDNAAISKLLFKRGLWLILLELAVMRFCWTFNFDLAGYNLAGVLWMIGWCMIALAALVWLPLGAIATLGLVIVFGHNLSDPYSRAWGSALAESPYSWIAQVLYFGGSFQVLGGPRLVILYSLLPWIGVMAAGYAFGYVMQMPAARRDRVCAGIGGAAVALFIALRTFNLYGEPRPWNPQQSWLTFLNTNKYPASLQYLLMTLGPLIALLPLFERARGKAADVLNLFGRVPLFFYVLHIPLIHVAAIVVSLIRTGRVTPWLFENHPMEPPPAPDGYRWSLLLLYTVWAICVTLLYFACRWYVARRSTRASANDVGLWPGGGIEPRGA
jgi:uncharacterized membrane protein